MNAYLYGCFAIVGGLVFIAFVIVVIIGATLIRNAPEGYEDGSGYHAKR